jgi:hypothetical protein
MSDTVEIAVGTGTWTLTIPEAKQVPLIRANTAVPTASPRELLHAALEAPIGLNTPLRRAVTPDDHVVIVIDEQVPHLGELVEELLAHLASGNVAPSAITLLVPPPSGKQEWVNSLPDEFSDVHIEVHDPDTPEKVAYLGNTKSGRRIYLNRTLVEAEFVVVLSGRRFDPRFGYTGAEVSLFPVLSNAETRKEFAAPGEPGEARKEAAVVAWHLGAPLFVQGIEGPGDTIAEVVAGLPESSAEGVKRQDARWRCSVESKADLVIVAVGGAAERVSFRSLTTAAINGRKVLKADGRLVVLTSAAPELDELKPWRTATKGTHLYVASGWVDDVVEDQLSATPLASTAELQRLIAAADRVIVIPDANKIEVKVL